MQQNTLFYFKGLLHFKIKTQEQEQEQKTQNQFKCKQ